MKFSGFFQALCLAAALALGVPSAHAQSAEPAAAVKKAKKAKKAKANATKRATFHDGSAESRKERDARLKRECKGKPNAGACEGYTR